MRYPLLLRIGGKELPHQGLGLSVGRELTGMGPACITSGTVLANRLGDDLGLLTWGALAGAPARAGALVRASVVDAVGGLVYCLHCHFLFGE